MQPEPSSRLPSLPQGSPLSLKQGADATTGLHMLAGKSRQGCAPVPSAVTRTPARAHCSQPLCVRPSSLAPQACPAAGKDSQQGFSLVRRALRVCQTRHHVDHAARAMRGCMPACTRSGQPPTAICISLAAQACPAATSAPISSMKQPSPGARPAYNQLRCGSKRSCDATSAGGQGLQLWWCLLADSDGQAPLKPRALPLTPV